MHIKYYILISEKISDLERENIALVRQIEEIAAQQTDRDKAIDDFSTAIDARINEWKVHRDVIIFLLLIRNKIIKFYDNLLDNIRGKRQRNFAIKRKFIPVISTICHFC